MYQGLNGNAPPRLSRTGSQICPSPEDELLEAVFNNSLPKIIQLISRNEYLLTHTYETYGKRILLIACSDEGVRAKTVKELLNLGANPRDHSKDDGYEALHYAALKTDVEVLKVLLEYNPGDINVVDQHGNNALQLLIRHGNKDLPDFLPCIKLLIQKGINLNHLDGKNKTALDWAKRKGVGDQVQDIINNCKPDELFNNNMQGHKDAGEQMLEYLNNNDESSFMHFCNTSDLANYNCNGSTMLQLCCDKGFAHAVRHLLGLGADPNTNGSKNNSKPIMIAVDHGYGEILETLLEHYNVSSVPNGLLATILTNIDMEHHDYLRCYRAYMKKIKDADPDEISLKVNEKDIKNNTPLHYAIRYAQQDIVEELLSVGASLGAKNTYGYMPIQDIEPDLLEKHLNNCVIFDNKSKKIDKEDFLVKFNYRSLIPPYAKHTYTESFTYKDVEATGMNPTIEKDLVAETEVVFFMSNAPEFKHLLKHPVIVSFLFMKWLRVQWLFWANLAFYITFALSLVVYIFTDYAYFSYQEKPTIHQLFSSLSYVCLLLTLIFLILREFFQICVAPTKYFRNFENYIEIVLIVITSMIVFVRSPTLDTRKQLSSIAILLSAFELVLMLGQHPYFSTNVVMLRTVSFNFFKFLIWYSLLIIAFALSFYLLFTNNLEPSESDRSLEVKNDTEVNEKDDDKTFENPGKSVFKTIIMLTGEFDASDLNFDTFPITSKLIFALFIFMIAIILLNLLNGLAVSDTQMIKNDAELVGHIARAQHIRYVESMLVGNLLPLNFVRKLSDICCCLPIAKHRNIRVARIFCTDACLFPKYLDYELKFYPNKNGAIASNENMQKKFRKSCAPCATICLDRETVRRTNDIVKSKRGSDDDKSMYDELRILREEIAAIRLLLNK